MSITVWRRHTPNCPHAHKGRDFLKCNCPLHADGYINGKREFRKSLGTRDMARARKRAAALEDPGEARQEKPIAEAITQFLAHCKVHGSKASTIRKYTTTMAMFQGYCEKKGFQGVHEVTILALDDYQVYRGVAPVTMKNELRLLRSFFKFSQARDWHDSNPAKEIPFPTVHLTEKQPYSKAEWEAIEDASLHIGHCEFERLRAHAMTLTFRFSALRIGDVAMLKKDRISWDGKKWRIFVRTTKRNVPVYLPVPQEMKDALDRVQSRGSQYYFWTGESEPDTMISIAHRVMRSVFRRSGVVGAHSHRFRHTIATEMLGQGATNDEVADVLGNTAEIVERYYGQWSSARQSRIDDLMEKVHSAATYTPTKLLRVK